jgi:hypothetical protein
MFPYPQMSSDLDRIPDMGSITPLDGYSIEGISLLSPSSLSALRAFVEVGLIRSCVTCVLFLSFRVVPSYACMHDAVVVARRAYWDLD